MNQDEAWPYISQWSKRGVVAFFVYTCLCIVFGSCLGMSANFNARFEACERATSKDLRERCCSCTQAELGRCGR